MRRILITICAAVGILAMVTPAADATTVRHRPLNPPCRLTLVVDPTHDQAPHEVWVCPPGWGHRFS